MSKNNNSKVKNKNDGLKYHAEYASIPVVDILKKFNSSIDGLSEKESKKRLEEYGYNEPPKKKKFSIAKSIASKFLNPLILILMVIVLFSLFFGEKISAFIVTIMIIIGVFLDFFQEYRSEKAMEKLNELVRTKITVRRNFKEHEINIRDLVPGDIVDLRAGDVIPADLRIISSKDLFINQATLTGESFPVEKISDTIMPKGMSITELSNMAYMGSSVVSGTGLGLVVSTGASTEFGEISKSIVTSTPTSFDIGIRQFTMLMIKFMIILVFFIFLIIFVIKQGNFMEALLFSLAVAVGLTPEMLPLFVTLNLSRGARAMSKKKVIVKKLHSIQNLGAMDILCTDKTGTLTMDRIILEKHLNVAGEDDDEVLEYGYINSFYQTGLKNLLDRAILKHEKLDMEKFKKIDEIPFDFSRKIMSVIVEDKGRFMVSKGAPEEIFKRCTHYELKNKIIKIDKKILENLKKEYDVLNEQGFRVIAVAYRPLNKKKSNYSKDDEEELILKGYMAFLDPPKPSAKRVIDHLARLGVEVKILTGDNEIVTKKICNDVNLNIKGMVTGDQIDSISDDELKVLAEKTTVFARVTPMQKERIIKALQANNHTVGYLGDGINDAPSLKRADVGISVNNAVDIAKESADIILLEKSLTILYKGVMIGRRTFGNIIKYIKMGASSNFGNMLSMTGATLFLPFLPMLPIQVLLNNFLYDMSNMAVPFDSVDKEYVSKPRKWNIKFIKKFMLYIGPLSSIFDFITFGMMIFIFSASPELFHTGWFIESLCSQTLVIYIIRTNKLPFVESKPRKILLASTIAVLMFAFILPFSPIAPLLGFTPLPLLYFAILAAMMVAYLTLVQLIKMWIVKKYGYQ